jgi:hypothetical protein
MRRRGKGQVRFRNDNNPWIQIIRKQTNTLDRCRGRCPCAQLLTKDMEGPLPRSHGARGFPSLPRCACADLRYASSFPLRLRLHSTNGRSPFPLRFATPAFARWRSACAAFQRGRAKAKPKEKTR